MFPPNTRTVIQTVTVEAIDLPLFEPFLIATGQFPAANSVLVRIELDNGVVGLGEAGPSLTSGGETSATIQAAIREMVTLLIGQDAAQWRTIAELLLTHFAAHSCARAAVEMALLDAITRTYSIPMYVWFGGATHSIETDISISIVTPDHARDLARTYAARGMNTIKIKVSGHLAEDEARIVAVRDGAPNAAIMIDGNQGYTVTGALRLLHQLDRHGIIPTLFEQPLHRDDWNGMVALTAQSSVPIAADEMVHSTADAMRVATLHAAHVINIKLVKSTILGALDIIGICRAARLGLMIGEMMESRLSTAVAAHLAAGTGGFSFCDLDTPMLINGDPFHGGYSQNGPHYELSEIRAGHGVERW